MSIRRASHAGSWYTDDEVELNAQLEEWLKDAAASSGLLGGGVDQAAAAHAISRVRALICPHAGLSYSGPTAAFAYASLPLTCKRVFILGPSHHHYLTGCALTRTAVYTTPVGDLNIDATSVEELRATGLFDDMSIDVDEAEHSIEMQLPFLAKLSQGRADVTLVPILVGNLTTEKEALYGEVLAPYLHDQNNFFIISSDFCHWGKRFGFQRVHEKQTCGKDMEIHQSIEALDRQGMKLIEQRDTKGFAQYLQETKNTICGRHPIGVLLQALDALDNVTEALGDDEEEQQQQQECSNRNKRHAIGFRQYAQSSPCMTMNDSSVSYAAGVVQAIFYQ